MSDIKTLCEIPDGAIPEEVIEICTYFDQEGVRRFQIRHSGDTQLSSTIGLLRLVEHNLIERSGFHEVEE